MLLYVCLVNLLLQSPSGVDSQVALGVIAKVGVNVAMKLISNIWKGDVVRGWKCAVENKSTKTLYALGTTPVSGHLATVLPDIPPQSTGMFVWSKSRGAARGAIGVVHYQYGNKVLNIMASIPYDWNLYGAWANARVTYQREPFSNLYYGRKGTKYPTRDGNWGKVDGTKFFLTEKSHAKFKVIFSG
uniref:Hydra actinoporin-like toxin 5 n=1 Tax=Hydra vulgaris TaxID=6087 RepID=ACTL5_HYDVU|nr:RecName: Full=Hydra actinoporin-like toxin 5; Short=HALT-5; AltName: Full=Alpha-pore-forming toxin; Short=alpha-PFT; AltName: Full=DELTA-hydritoxin-Hma1e; Short=DELTA-HYTX-Hma1e; Flags: Precursor [Hydra vulgaris]